MKVETPKHGFVLYFDRVELAARNLDDQKLGQLCRAIFMRTPKPKFDAPELSICYDFLVDGIKQNYKLYDETKKKRRYNYLLNKPQRTAKQEAELRELSLYLNLQEKTATSTATSTSTSTATSTSTSTATSTSTSTATSTATPSETIKYKNYDSKNKIFFNNPQYVRNYLAQKKLFLKKEAFDDFCEYNDGLGWPIKPETAFRRWVKKNPEDEEKPKTEKKAPDLPATPAPLLAFENEFKEALRDVINLHDYKTFFEGLQLIKITETMNGDKILFATRTKFIAEYIRENYANNVEQTYFALKSRKCLGVDFCFVDNYAKELKFLTSNVFDYLIKEPAAEKKTTPMPESLKKHLKNLTSQNVYNQTEAEASN